jgi:vancomycin resistance protein YoaR
VRVYRPSRWRRRLLVVAVVVLVAAGVAAGVYLGVAAADDPVAAPATSTSTTTSTTTTTPEPPPTTTTPQEPYVVVGSFTTPYDCCPPRVTNIRRAARDLDGMTIPPGGRFSMNEALGERTLENGYVGAPSISGAELVDSVGGGISQVATTLYNAAFFSGLRLVAHTPHSFYISRYPPGREATISWGGPELIFVNDWAAPLVMHVIARDTSITVRFVSRRLGRRVTSWLGKPHDEVPPTRIVRPTLALAVGERRVVQSAGSGGFTIEYGRRVYQDGKLRSSESFRWTYQPENEIVEIGQPDG